MSPTSLPIASASLTRCRHVWQVRAGVELCGVCSRPRYPRIHPDGERLKIAPSYYTPMPPKTGD